MKTGHWLVLWAVCCCWTPQEVAAAMRPDEAQVAVLANQVGYDTAPRRWPWFRFGIRFFLSLFSSSWSISRVT